MEQPITAALRGLKMPGMAECWKSMEETHQLDKLSLRDGFPLMIQSEVDNREINKISKLIKKAGFRLPATIEELDLNPVRGVSQESVSQLLNGEYIKRGATVIIGGPTGTGKTYLANALGEKACRQGFKVAYFTMQKLLDSIRIARLEGKDQKLMEKILKMDLLILDDFGMKVLEGQQQNDFQQILDDRYNRKAIIISTQLPVSDWHALFKNELIADACLDRIVHKSVRFQLKGDSLRKKY